MGFIARVFGTFAGQTASSASHLPATTSPRRAVSTPALARSPLKAGSIFARFGNSNTPPELPLVRDSRGRLPSAKIRRRAIERLTPRLDELSVTVSGLRLQLGQLESSLQPVARPSTTQSSATQSSQTQSSETQSSEIQSSETQSWAVPANAVEARYLEQRLSRLEHFGQALGDLAKLRQQLDASLTGSGGAPT